jgi:hypothetical protein
MREKTCSIISPTSHGQGTLEGCLNACVDLGISARRVLLFFCIPLTIGNILLAGLSLVLWDSGSAQAAPPPGYNLVFDEEFNGPLDVPPWTGWAPGHKWTTHTPYGGDFGQAYSTGPDENATTPDPI